MTEVTSHDVWKGCGAAALAADSRAGYSVLEEVAMLSPCSGRSPALWQTVLHTSLLVALDAEPGLSASASGFLLPGLVAQLEEVRGGLSLSLSLSAGNREYREDREDKQEAAFCLGCRKWLQTVAPAGGSERSAGGGSGRRPTAGGGSGRWLREAGGREAATGP